MKFPKIAKMQKMLFLPLWTKRRKHKLLFFWDRPLYSAGISCNDFFWACIKKNLHALFSGTYPPKIPSNLVTMFPFYFRVFLNFSFKKIFLSKNLAKKKNPFFFQNIFWKINEWVKRECVGRKKEFPLSSQIRKKQKLKRQIYNQFVIKWMR